MKNLFILLLIFNTAGCIAADTESKKDEAAAESHPLKPFFSNWKVAQVPSVKELRNTPKYLEPFVGNSLRTIALDQNPDVNIAALQSAIEFCFTKPTGAASPKAKSKKHFGEERMRRKSQLHLRSKSMIEVALKPS